jgi:hypothetical protein
VRRSRPFVPQNEVGLATGAAEHGDRSFCVWTRSMDADSHRGRLPHTRPVTERFVESRLFHYLAAADQLFDLLKERSRASDRRHMQDCQQAVVEQKAARAGASSGFETCSGGRDRSHDLLPCGHCATARADGCRPGTARGSSQSTPCIHATGRVSDGAESHASARRGWGWSAFGGWAVPQQEPLPACLG